MGVLDRLVEQKEYFKRDVHQYYTYSSNHPDGVLGHSEDLLDRQEPDQRDLVDHHHDSHEKAERVRRNQQVVVSLVFHLARLLPTLRKFII